MKTVGISDFKSHALAMIDRVASTKDGLVITKRGKPLVQVIPFQSAPSDATPGRLAHTLVFEKDIVSPLGPELWEACR